MMNTEKFQVTQIPLNFIETEPVETLLPLALKLNMGFIAMKSM